MPRKIISGGQTGADLGGLVGARRAGIPTGGFAAGGYRTERGPQEAALRQFGLVPHASAAYPPRTEDNVRHSDATLIFCTAKASAGTRMTIEFCSKHVRPYTVIDPRSDSAVAEVRAFFDQYRPDTLNIAGNRETVSPGIAAAVAGIISAAFRADTEA
ncbi:YpsA SLOG family protein [Halioglobus sp. HI00S01]|uniref:YpsA SLOG family protein n=1 Tax=Halioglobus sp. HI00S01 TaxID=1822214 RepID=UPI000825B273|nr:putative molybdenum carrier protein [Halioglobus sp. HI00S01]